MKSFKNKSVNLHTVVRNLKQAIFDIWKLIDSKFIKIFLHGQWSI